MSAHICKAVSLFKNFSVSVRRCRPSELERSSAKLKQREVTPPPAQKPFMTAGQGPGTETQVCVCMYGCVRGASYEAFYSYSWCV